MDRVKIGIVGINHGHIHGMVAGLLAAGGAEIAAGYAAEPDLRAQFDRAVGPVPWRDSAEAVIGSPEIDLICCASINGDRGRILLDALAAGKSVFVDKPMVTRLEELEAVERAVEASPGSVFVFYGERLTRTIDPQIRRRIEEGEIGRVVHFMGLGPHKLRLHDRPAWMFDKEKYGGILCDIASHQFELFLYYAADRIVPGPSRTANFTVPQHPEFEDFGDACFTAPDGAAGYVRVDWLTPEAMPTFGDIRQFIIGDRGQIEIRRNFDLGGKPATTVFLTTGVAPPRRIEFEPAENTFFSDLLRDVRDGVNRCIPHRQAFEAARAAILHERDAVRIRTADPAPGR